MKKFLIILIIILVIGITVYLQNSLIPSKIQTAADDFAANILHKELQISDLKVSIFKGVILNGVFLYEKDSKLPFLTAEKIVINPLYPSFLTSKKVISSIHLENTRLYLTRDEDGKLKTADIESQPKTKDVTIVTKVSAENFNLIFEDKQYGLKKNFSNISFSAALGLSREIKTSVNWPGKLKAKGEYSLVNESAKADIVLGDIDLVEFSPYLKFLRLKSGKISGGKLHLKGKQSYSLKGAINTEDISLASEDFELHGDFDLNPEIEFSPEKTTYLLSGKIKNGRGKNIPAIKTLSAINADFILDDKNLKVTSLKGELLKGTPVTANGEFDFINGDLAIKAKTNTSLARLAQTLKESELFNFDYQGKGSVSLEYTLTTNLNQESFNHHALYRIKGAETKDLKQINAKGYIDTNSFVLQEGSLKYKNVPFEVIAKIDDFSDPVINIDAKSDLLKIAATGHYDQETVHFSKFLISGEKSRILTRLEAAFKDPAFINAEGKGTIYLEEIKQFSQILEQEMPWFDKLNPSGGLEIKFIVSGGLDPEKWIIKLAGSSHGIKIYDIPVQRVKIELFKTDKELIVSPLIARLKEGKIDFRTSFDFEKDKVILDLVAEKINLAKIRPHLKIKDRKVKKRLSGNLSLQAYVENTGISQWDKLNGQGKIIIKKGNIWELDFLRGLGEFLFIPEFEDIRFEEGYSDLVFKEDKVFFENLELISPEMNINGAGSISLKGDLNFELYPVFNPLLVSSSEGLKKITTQFLGKSGLIIEIKGTVKKPSYNVKPAFLTPIKNIKKFLKELLN